MVEKESKGKQLQTKLTKKERIVWDEISHAETRQVMELGEEYKKFLNASKTERLCVSHIISVAREKGFLSLEELESKGPLSPGTKFYINNRGKALVLGVLGSEPLANGIRLVGAHVDAPRLDLKPNPLYESEGLALFKTHYYGGIKKYQWTAVPMAIHGIIVLADGRQVEVAVGESAADPVFTITDLLPHLAKDQMKKKMTEGIAGEELNVVIGSIPYPDKELKERVKLAVLEYLHNQYGLVEEDFVSAELEVVPAGPARDIGFDRSLVGAYGQDDRICAFATMQAVFQVGEPKFTVIGLFADKEEIGSAGNTGMESFFLLNAVSRLAVACGEHLNAGRVLALSHALSADVNAAEDPNYEGVLDKRNAARLGGGVVLTKYTGSGGKYGANDAHAEFVGAVRRLFNRERIVWQSAELGKVDQGGGGTIAQFLSNMGIEVIDCGPPLLSMHAPFEVSSKADLYMTCRAYTAFLAADYLYEK